MPSQDPIWNLLSRMENGFGRLEEGQKGFHKRLDRLEAKVDMQNRSRPTTGLWRALSIFLTHWQPAVMLALMGLAFMGILKPDAAKKLMELAK